MHLSEVILAYVLFGISASPGSSTCLAVTTPANHCFWESVMATAWALVATATSQEEEGNYEHSFLQILSALTSVSVMQGQVCGGGANPDM